jgi:hypothetical protein
MELYPQFRRYRTYSLTPEEKLENRIYRSNFNRRFSPFNFSRFNLINARPT